MKDIVYTINENIFEMIIISQENFDLRKKIVLIFNKVCSYSNVPVDGLVLLGDIYKHMQCRPNASKRTGLVYLKTTI